jgi:rhamnose utilization protein RhaD (predicted bifunctional aldolase and dehydrogenase)
LVDLSHYAARHPDFVQGGGGNCSVKSTNTMLIKASGFFLEDVTLENGYVSLEIDTMKPLINQDLRPSLETAIHFLLGRYVIHTHPVVVGAIVCAKEGKQAFNELFKGKNYFWIDYASPGKNLYEKIQSFVKINNIDLNKPLVLFLKNHGIFVSASNKDICVGLHEEVIRTLSGYFSCILDPSKDINLKGFLTPDHVVYSGLDRSKLSKKQKIAISELNNYSNMVSELIRLKKWETDYLSDNDVDFIKNMEEEKYRQKLLEAE